MVPGLPHVGSAGLVDHRSSHPPPVGCLDSRGRFCCRRVRNTTGPPVGRGTSQVFIYKVLQHGSTLMGLSLLTLWGWRWFIAIPCTSHVPRLAAPRSGAGARLVRSARCSSDGWYRLGYLASRRCNWHEGSTGVCRPWGNPRCQYVGANLLALGDIWRLWEMRAVQRPNRRLEPTSQRSVADHQC